MALPIYQVDAFSDRVFGGNPAAVMPLDAWPDDEVLQLLAMENNLSETAFFVEARKGEYELRWFTPSVEIDLCGHATLASAHVLFAHLGHAADEIVFHTRSGELRVMRGPLAMTMDFPVNELQSAEVDPDVCRALGAQASEAFEPVGSGGLLYIYEFEEDIARLQPDFAALKRLSPRPVIVTAPGDTCDVVSRFFGPQVGIDEDPVTGSAHCSLVPYWSKRLRRARLHCRQLSARGGSLDCELREGRVFMTGKAVTFMQGEVKNVAD